MFDPQIHPIWVQFRPVLLFNHSDCSVKIDCENSQVILTETSDQNKTAIQTVVPISERKLTELLSFLRTDTIEAFEAIPEEEKVELELGYPAASNRSWMTAEL